MLTVETFGPLMNWGIGTYCVSALFFEEVEYISIELLQAFLAVGTLILSDLVKEALCATGHCTSRCKVRRPLLLRNVRRDYQEQN